MTRACHSSISLCLSLAVLGLAGCALGPAPVRLSGAETTSATDRPRIVPAAFTRTGDGTRMELAAADGTAFAGVLQTVREPVVVPLAAPGAAPLVGGATDLVGTVAGGGMVLDCRFRLLNPVRGLDGGGTGRCEGPARQVDFLF
jgi:hypothetical protein